MYRIRLTHGSRWKKPISSRVPELPKPLFGSLTWCAKAGEASVKPITVAERAYVKGLLI